MGRGNAVNWHDKVTELRREIDTRHKIYRRSIVRAAAVSTGVGPVSGNDYRMNLVYLECMQHFYWFHLAFSSIGRNMVRTINAEPGRHYVGDWLNLSDPAILPDTDYWLKYANGTKIDINMARRGADLRWHDNNGGQIVPNW